MEMAGEVSKQKGERGHICELQWHSGELRKARSHERECVTGLPFSDTTMETEEFLTRKPP